MSFFLLIPPAIDCLLQHMICFSSTKELMCAAKIIACINTLLFLLAMAFFFFFLVLIITLPSACAANLPSNASYLPRNLTLVNRPHIAAAEPFKLEENSATAVCFDNVVMSLNFHLCFVNTTSNQYTFSILTFDNIYPVENRMHYRVVWSANRNTPVKQNAVFKMQENGDLTLHDSDQTLVWSSNTANQNVSGLYLNKWGNLAIFNDLYQTLWQSFDRPTDTLLRHQVLHPGMQLISRVSDEDGGEGRYSLKMEVGGLALYDRSSVSDPQPYWIFGCHGKNDSFSLTHTCNQQFSFGLNDYVYLDFIPFVPQENTSSHDYSPELCKLNTSSCSDPTGWEFDLTLSLDLNISFIRIEKDGFLRGYSYDDGQWIKRFDLLQSDPCALPNACGPYGICSSSNGSCACLDDGSSSNLYVEVSSNQATANSCPIPSQTPTCTNDTIWSSHSQKTFINFTGVDYLANAFGPDTSHMDLPECLQTCFGNCSCTAVFYHTETQACYPHYNALQTLRTTNSSTFLAFLKVDAITVLHNHKWKRVYVPAIIAGAISCMLVLCLYLLAWQLICRKFRSGKISSDNEWLQQVLPALPTRYTYKDLKKMTKGFSKVLGSGGFGKVYQGVLADGSLVAVKRLFNEETFGNRKAKAFRAEVAILGAIHHLNLVKLRGFCVEGAERLLVYEYMPNGSLDKWILQSSSDHGSSESVKVLEWSLRYNIALGTARGLAYLHEGCKERIIHLDVKPQNILLDSCFNPKVSDFGLSRLVTRGDYKMSALTTIRGTPGYLAPEWLWKGPITDKTDVFSFGLVLMEIASGRSNFDETVSPLKDAYFPAVVIRKAEKGRMAELPDRRLGLSVDFDQAERMIRTAMLCIQTKPSMRPSMEVVVQMLEGSIDVLNIPVSRLAEGIHGAFKCNEVAIFAAEELGLNSGTLSVILGSSDDEEMREQTLAVKSQSFNVT